MDIANRVQILDEAVCISHSTNTFRKGSNPTILLLTKSKMVGQSGLFNVGMTSGLGERILNSNLARSSGAVEYTDCITAEV